MFAHCFYPACSCWGCCCNKQEPVGQRPVLNHQGNWSEDALQQIRQGASTYLFAIVTGIWVPSTLILDFFLIFTMLGSLSSGCRCQGGDQCQEPGCSLLWVCHHVFHRGGNKVHKSPSQDWVAWKDDLCGEGEGILWMQWLHFKCLRFL